MLIDTCCDITQAEEQTFRELLMSLIEHYCDEGVPFLERVMVVPDGRIEEVVNLLFDSLGIPSGYVMGPYRTDAVAIPYTDEIELRCFVLFGSTVIRQIVSSNEYYSGISSVLEELLHTKFYSIVWQQHKRLLPKTENLTQERFYRVASFCLDEYVVGRTTAKIMSEQFCIVDSLGRQSPYRIWYGGNLVDLLDDAPVALDDGLRNCENRTNDERISVSLEIAKRYVFEPLTRDAAFREAHIDSGSLCPTSAASESEFYRSQVSVFWSAILSELEADFDANCDGREAAVIRIADQIEAFLDRLVFNTT